VRHRTAWSVVVTVAVVVGAWTALLGWTGPGVVFTFLPSALVGVCVAGYLLPDDRSSAGLLLRYGALTGTVVVAAGGLTDLLGPQAAASSLVAIAVTSPWSVRWLRVRLRIGGPAVQPVGDQPSPEIRHAATREQPLAGAAGPPTPELMTDRELCEAWCSSYLLLTSVRAADERAAVVHLRQRYLDELERRHPEGLRRWLALGSRAASNPARFLSGERPGTDTPE
jgi:hypothetical protein